MTFYKCPNCGRKGLYKREIQHTSLVVQAPLRFSPRCKYCNMWVSNGANYYLNREDALPENWKDLTLVKKEDMRETLW